MLPSQPVKDYPFYIKAPAILLGLVLAVYILYELGGILVPLAFSVLIAILLNPLTVKLQRRLPKMVAIIFAILLAIAVLVGLLYFLSTQINAFSAQIPLLKKKVDVILQQGQDLTQRYFGFNLQKETSSLSSKVGGVVTSTLSTVMGIVSVVLIIPIYVFMLLYYKPLILDFLFRVFQEEYSENVAAILNETKGAVQSYMLGLLMEMAIVCTLNSIALLLIGVPSAIVIGVIGGILNVIPYIGGLIAIALPVLMATVVSEGYTMQLLVVGAYMLIQFVDNNVIVPGLVSSKVKLNALISIVAVFLGSALWGFAGMFLSIPIIGVLKIVFDRIEGLKPWGLLLGDEIPTEESSFAFQKKSSHIIDKAAQKA